MSQKVKLTHDEQIEVCRQIAAYRRLSEIVKFIKEKFGKTLHYMSVKEYATSPKWEPVIAKLRQEYIAGVMEEPMASKRMRLKYLDEIYKQAVAKGNIRRAIEAVSQADKEMEKR